MEKVFQVIHWAKFGARGVVSIEGKDFSGKFEPCIVLLDGRLSAGLRVESFNGHVLASQTKITLSPIYLWRSLWVMYHLSKIKINREDVSILDECYIAASRVDSIGDKISQCSNVLNQISMDLYERIMKIPVPDFFIEQELQYCCQTLRNIITLEVEAGTVLWDKDKFRGKILHPDRVDRIEEVLHNFYIFSKGTGFELEDLGDFGASVGSAFLYFHHHDMDMKKESFGDMMLVTLMIIKFYQKVFVSDASGLQVDVSLESLAEQNDRIISHVASWLFCKYSELNLFYDFEGIAPKSSKREIEFLLKDIFSKYI